MSDPGVIQETTRARTDKRPRGGPLLRPGTRGDLLSAQRRAPYFFLAPMLVLLAVFFVYPFFYAAVLAFYQTSGPASRIFVGLDNFRFILSDPDFYIALRNTTVFAFFSIFLQLPLSLGLALLLNNRRDRMKGFFRLILFSPHLVGPIFVGILFSVMFTPRFGLVNNFFQSLIGWGFEERWLNDPTLVMPAIILISLWMYVGFNMIYFLAALQAVDRTLEEAAQIDGANKLQVFWNVTVPAIKPVAVFVVVVSTIGSYQLFELPYALLQGSGPKNSGLTIIGYLYDYAFEGGDLGIGSAIAWLLTSIIFTISLVQVRLSGVTRDE